MVSYRWVYSLLYSINSLQLHKMLVFLASISNEYMYIFQISEGLTFLHNDVKLVHYNICPQSIVLNKSGAWKIAGLEFCIRNANTTDQAVSYTL